MNEYQVTFASTFEEADQKAIELTACLKDFYGERLDSGLEFNLNFVIRELLNNAVEHGNQFDVNKKVHCTCVYDDKAIILQVADQGEGIRRPDDPVEFLDSEETHLPSRQRGLWLVEQLGFILALEKNTVRAIYKWRVEQ